MPRRAVLTISRNLNTGQEPGALPALPRALHICSSPLVLTLGLAHPKQ